MQQPHEPKVPTLRVARLHSRQKPSQRLQQRLDRLANRGRPVQNEHIGGEISNELFKSVRLLFILAALIGIVTVGFSSKRILAVSNLTTAAEEYAVDALDRTRLSEEVSVAFNVQGIGPARVRLAPTKGEFTISVPQALEAVGNLLLDNGFVPLFWDVSLKSSAPDEIISVQLLPTDRKAEWAFLEMRNSARSRSLQIVGDSSSNQALWNTLEQRITDRCQDKLLPIKFEFESENQELQDKLRAALSKQQLRLGPQRLWGWSGFRRIETDGSSRPLVPVVHVGNLNIFSSHFSAPSYFSSDAPLNCFAEYRPFAIVSWTKELLESSSYVFQRPWLLTDKDHAHILTDEQETLTRGKVALTSDLQVSSFLAGMLLPYATLILSINLSLLLRQQYSTYPTTVSSILWKQNRALTRITRFDFLGLALIENVFRVASIWFAILSLPLSPILSLYSVWFPAIANSQDVTLLSLLPFAPAGWLLLPLAVLAAHQATIVFRIPVLLLTHQK